MNNQPEILVASLFIGQQGLLLELGHEIPLQWGEGQLGRGKVSAKSLDKGCVS